MRTIATAYTTAILCLASARGAAALDVSGKVVNRFGAGMADAKVCVQGGGPCAQTAADGSFRLQGPVSLGRSAGESLAGYSLHAGAGRLTVRSPEARGVWIDWSDAGGRRNGARSSLDLQAGDNALSVPGGADAGLLFLRLSADGLSKTWAVLVREGAAVSAVPVDRGEARRSPAGGALAKASGAPPLVASKAGYAPFTYQPGAEEEKDAILLLSPEGETTQLLFNGKNFDGWDMSAKAIGGAPGSWTMKEGAFHSEGTIRGTLSTKQDHGSFRILFTLRHLPSTGSDHQPCVVIWGTRPPPNDALGGIQFQPPNGGHWDYRPGKNNAGSGFSKVAHDKLSTSQWAQCEIWAKQSTGEARMACCNLTGAAPCKGVEVLRFKDATAGKKGPIGLQIHNKGLHDEYKNITIETDPKVEDLITTKL